jgi:Tol biopolymer transport system component
MLLRFARRVPCLVIVLLLVVGGSTAAPGTFPGTNGPIVFDGVDVATRTVQIYRIAANGTGMTQLTSTTGGVWNECPSFSADGRSIYFDSVDRSQPNASEHIYRMNADGSGRQLADRQNAPAHACPGPGPGGTKIAAMQYPRQGGSSIIRMNTNGSGRQILARAQGRQSNYGPTYAPNGRQILFNRVTYAARVGFARADLLISTGPGRVRNITASDNAAYFSPSWSPDGRAILAVRGVRAATIVQMNANGGDVHVLRTVTGGAWLANPMYSPDGTKIAYFQCEGDCGDPLLPDAGKGSIWVMNADGSDAKAILTQEASGVPPASAFSWGVAAS